MFVRPCAYELLGEFRSLAPMADYDFNRRLERFGPTLMIPEPLLVTSSRPFTRRSKLAIVGG